MNDSFGLAAFRSRTQVLRMEDALHRAGLSAGVIATPREVAIGCGLSVRFDLAQTPQVMQVYRRLSPGALIGFYRVEGYGTRRLTLTPLVEKPIYNQPRALTRGCLWGIMQVDEEPSRIGSPARVSEQKAADQGAS